MKAFAYQLTEEDVFNVLSNNVLDTVFDPVSPEGYAVVLADKSRQIYWQDRLDSFFGGRVVDVRNALREVGWEGEPRSRILTRDSVQIEFEPLQVGAGANVVGGSWRLLTTNNMKASLNTRTIATLPDVLIGTAGEFADQIDSMMTRESTRISENSGLSPQELTFKEFSEIARAVKLENHGRQWSVRFGTVDLGFADGPSVEAGLRQVHSCEVNNAIYSHLPDAAVGKAVFPPENVLAEYPDMRVKFADVFEARDVIQRTQNVVEAIGGFVADHSDWWDSQLELAGNNTARVELQSWLALVGCPGDPSYAAQSLSQFVGLVEGGRLDWLDAADLDGLENKLFAEAKGIVNKAVAKAGAQLVSSGQTIGLIVQSDDGVVTQKVGRDPAAVVRHGGVKLSRIPEVGEVVDIKYQDGIGRVSDRAVVVEKAR